MITPSDHMKLAEVYRRLDDCHDYQLLDKYIEVISNTAKEYPHQEFEKLLDYARRRRQFEFNKVFLAVIDV